MAIEYYIRIITIKFIEFCCRLIKLINKSIQLIRKWKLNLIRMLKWLKVNLEKIRVEYWKFKIIWEFNWIK